MTNFDSISRRFVLLLAGATLALSACSGGGDTAVSTGGADGKYTVADDYILGKANAPVTLVEYASVACPGCAYWHQNVYPDIKTKYVDTGKVKYVFRPFPASNIEIATAGHKLALCADRDKFFKNVKIQFDRQSQIFEMGQRGQLRQAYISLAKASGLSEEEFISCMSDPDITSRYDAFTQLGMDQGVAGTPSFFVNGKRVAKNDLESLEAAILPVLGETVPAESSED